MGLTYYCPSPEDLVFSKLAAGREKDFGLVQALLTRKLIKLASVRRFIAAIGDPVFQKLMHERLTVVASTIPDTPRPKGLQHHLNLPQDRSRSNRRGLDR
jgi:hypothetical protein